MFPVIVRHRARGRTYEHVHVCESVWRNGQSQRRTIVSLGSRQLLSQHLDRILELCRGHKAGASGPIPLASFCSGPFLVLRRLWAEFPMADVRGPISDRALALVTNRLTRPASEHGLAERLATFFACDSPGCRFAPACRSEGGRKASRCPRVRVQAFQLQRWHRTLDALLPLKDAIPDPLPAQLRLGVPRPDQHVLPGRRPSGAGAQRPLARPAAAQSTDPRRRDDGRRPAAVLTVFAGNLRGCTTVREVLADVRKRFGLGRFVLVGDRGMRPPELPPGTLSAAAIRGRPCGLSAHRYCIRTNLTRTQTLQNNHAKKRAVSLA